MKNTAEHNIESSSPLMVGATIETYDLRGIGSHSEPGIIFDASLNRSAVLIATSALQVLGSCVRRLLFLVLALIFSGSALAAFPATIDSTGVNWDSYYSPLTCLASPEASCAASSLVGWPGNFSIVQQGQQSYNYPLGSCTNFAGSVFYSTRTCNNLSCPARATFYRNTSWPESLTQGHCICKANQVQNASNTGCECPAGLDWIEGQQKCMKKTEKLDVTKVAKPTGQMCHINPKRGHPIQPLTGIKSLEVGTGVSIGGSPLVLTYSTSRQISTGVYEDAPSFGKLWMSSLHRKLAIASNMTDFRIYRGSESSHGFTFIGGAFISDSGPNHQLSAITGGYLYVDVTSGIVETYNTAGQLTEFYGTDASKLTFAYSTGASSDAPGAGYLMSVTDISAATPRTVSFKYSLTHNKLIQIADQDGRTTSASYDSNGNLSGLTWPNLKTRTFHYEDTTLPWALTGVTDERNIRYATYAYDAAGRATSTELAGGVSRYSVVYGTPPAAIVTEVADHTNNVLYRVHSIQHPTGVVVTAPNGQTQNWNNGTVDGIPVLLGSNQPAGSGCASATSASTIDAVGNLLSHDDFSGNRVCFAYDANHREITRVEGLATTVDCSSVLPSGATLPAGSRKVSTQWHADWLVPTIVTSPGVISNVIHQGQVDPLTGTVANCTPAANMPHGKPLPLVCKTIVRSTSIAGNSDGYGFQVPLLLSGDGTNGSTVINNSGISSAITVSAVGDARIRTDQSKFGGASMYFDGSGDQFTMPNSADFRFGTGDYTVEFWIRAATITNYMHVFQSGDYATNQWSVRTNTTGKVEVFFNGGANALGVLSSSSSVPLNVWAHVAVSRAAGITRIFIDGEVKATSTAVYDVNGTIGLARIGSRNDTSLYQMNGYLDELRITNGVARYTANFTAPTVAFPGNLIDKTVTSTFTYDSAGRILTSVDGNNQTTTYSYHSGTSFTGVDPNAVGHTAGDLQSVTNAAGHVTQFTQYDKAGRIKQMVDPKGVVTDVSYSPRGWVTAVVVTPPGLAARTTTYSYDDAGQMTQVASPDGSTIVYTYDAAHRLTEVTDAKGNKITFTLDTMGNRVTEVVKDPGGVLQRSISRSFDALNRLQQVTGAQR